MSAEASRPGKKTRHEDTQAPASKSGKGPVVAQDVAAREAKSAIDAIFGEPRARKGGAPKGEEAAGRGGSAGEEGSPTTAAPHELKPRKHARVGKQPRGHREQGAARKSTVGGLAAASATRRADAKSQATSALDRLGMDARMESSSGTRRTEEGYRIYTTAELGIGQGGDTDLCPFDCDCCF